MTYWAINAPFLAVTAAVGILALVLVARRRRAGLRRWAVPVALAVLLAMTAVFDNAMIGVGLVGYDPDRISGVRVGIAPLEDFAYAVAAAVLLPSLWVLLGRRTSRADRATPAGPDDATRAESHASVRTDDRAEGRSPHP